MDDLTKAKELIKNAKCVLVNGDSVLISKETGISPMMLWLEAGNTFPGYTAADTIIGRASAMLLKKAEVAEVYGEVMSKGAYDYLTEQNIPVTYGTIVDKIINRTGDDICPMEKTVQGVDDFEEGFTLLQKKWHSLRNK